MKKILVLSLMLAITSFGIVNAADKTAKQAAKAQKQALKAQKKAAKVEKEAVKIQAKKEKEAAKVQAKQQKKLANELKNPKDVIKDAEYKDIKTKYFNTEGYGDTYNCKVAQQRFCKVKDLDTGVYVLCDREVSRTQMESAKIFYKLGRCTKLN